MAFDVQNTTCGIHLITDSMTQVNVYNAAMRLIHKLEHTQKTPTQIANHTHKTRKSNLRSRPLTNVS